MPFQKIIILFNFFINDNDKSVKSGVQKIQLKTLSRQRKVPNEKYILIAW